MPSFPSRFRRLDAILADLPLDDPLLLTELDGYLTAIVLCPTPLEPAAWLPPIWGGAYGEAAPFEDPIDVRLFAEMVQARHAEILRELGRGKPQPIFDVDERTGEVLWEEWIGGFALAMETWPDAWSAVAGDSAAAEAMSELRALVEIVLETSVLTSVEINAICDTAAAAIPRHVLRLYGPARTDAPREPAASAKPGRNTPCPCGSGKKHKRCCGT